MYKRQGEDDVKQISLTELTEPRQIHPEGSNLRIRHSLKLQWNIPAQVFMVTLPALPIPDVYKRQDCGSFVVNGTAVVGKEQNNPYNRWKSTQKGAKSYEISI